MAEYRVTDPRTRATCVFVACSKEDAAWEFVDSGFAPDLDGVEVEQITQRTTLLLRDDRHGMTATCERDTTATGRERRYTLDIWDGKSTTRMHVARTLLKQVLRTGTTITARV